MDTGDLFWLCITQHSFDSLRQTISPQQLLSMLITPMWLCRIGETRALNQTH